MGDTGAAYSMVMLDRFAVTYPRRPLAQAGRLEGSWGESGVAEVLGLGAGVVLDLTDASPAWLAGTERGVPGALRFRVEAGRRYLAVAESALLRAELRRPSTSRLKDPRHRADYLVIGPGEFLAAAGSLLDWRRGEGLQVKAVPLEEIFAEFGSGETRPEAIREFISYAYHHWRGPSLRYVLLLGDATYDFKNYLGTGVVNRVPPLMVRTSFLWTAANPLYAAVNGEDALPDLALGRLPAATVEEARAMAEKVVAYERRFPHDGSPVVLVADHPDAAGDFVADAEQIAASLPGANLKRIYLSQLGVEATRAAIREAFDGGAALMSYVGHGGIHLWASERPFDTEQAKALSPQTEQPLLLTMNCLNGYFHFPYFDSLAEALLKARERGAIAAFSPSGMSLNGPAHLFHQALLRELLYGSHQRLGDALLAGQGAYAESGAFPELLSIYQSRLKIVRPSGQLPPRRKASAARSKRAPQTASAAAAAAVPAESSSTERPETLCQAMAAQAASQASPARCTARRLASPDARDQAMSRATSGTAWSP